MAKANAIAATKTEDDWEVEENLRILTRAIEIKKNPKMMAKVRAMAREKIKRMESLTSVDETKK